MKPLNGTGPGAATEEDPVGLSRQLLAAAREARPSAPPERLAELAARLRGIDPVALAGDPARLAFWANLYNALFLHRVCLRPARGNMLLHLRLFGTAAYQVGGQVYSLNLIEHGVLRRNRRPPLQPRRPLRAADLRLATRPSRLDPRVHFALNCGARSCPPIHAYDPDALDRQLELATRSYLRAETAVDSSRGRVTLPRLMRIYRADFGDRAAQLRLAARHVEPLRRLLAERSGAVRVRYGRFDWTAAPADAP